MTRRIQAPITDVRARVFEIPTDAPEADGTLSWASTTLITVEVAAGGQSGLGYTYTAATVAHLINGALAEVIRGTDALDIPLAWQAMRQRSRNLGIEGIAAATISAVDAALWDLKAQLLGLPLCLLLGRVRETVSIYGSGGFTCYDDGRLFEQLASFVEHDGCAAVKIKIGAQPDRDPKRIAIAKEAIGANELFVDANGAFTPRQAIRLLQQVDAQDIRWFEEPVSSDDLSGMRFVREHAGAATEIAAGEYGYTPGYFRRMLEAGAVDVLQADATRCLGFSGFLEVAALCDCHHVDLSAHCAPALHLAVGLSVPRLRHLEWFHDHARIEAMLFDGAPVPKAGVIRPDLSRPGLGLVLKQADAAKFEKSVSG